MRKTGEEEEDFVSLESLCQAWKHSRDQHPPHICRILSINGQSGTLWPSSIIHLFFSSLKILRRRRRVLQQQPDQLAAFVPGSGQFCHKQKHRNIGCPCLHLLHSPFHRSLPKIQKKSSRGELILAVSKPLNGKFHSLFGLWWLPKTNISES